MQRQFCDTQRYARSTVSSRSSNHRLHVLSQFNDKWIAADSKHVGRAGGAAAGFASVRVTGGVDDDGFQSEKAAKMWTMDSGWRRDGVCDGMVTGWWAFRPMAT
jgi:hypothetical protein